MIEHALVIEVHLAEDRYHGMPEWPPSPARLFQALVAGAGHRLGEPGVREALEWLEVQPPPLIGAPRQRVGSERKHWVPNNDLDAKQGDPANLPKIRVAKSVRPRLIEGSPAFVYVWPLAEASPQAEIISALAASLYQLGRGVDAAWATGRVGAAPSLEEAATVHHPTPGGRGGVSLACPRSGTLASLVERHRAQGRRFQRDADGKGTTFSQPPRPVLQEVAYDSPALVRLYDLRDVDGSFALEALPRAHQLTVAVRDAAATRLRDALDPGVPVDAALIGRRPGDGPGVPTDQRLHLLPLPSIGHVHADRAIRRVVATIPRHGPVAPDDLAWALSSLQVGDARLVPSDDQAMLGHYCRPSRRWRTVTAASLPVSRRRIDPGRRDDEAKPGSERLREEERTIAAVRQALRHAGVRARPVRIAVQREPWERAGARAEAFEAPPRFAKTRSWHVDVELDRAIEGPLAIGDGRFLGLGVMAPVRFVPGVYGWSIVDGLSGEASPEELAEALRRAVMARARDAWGSRDLPGWITGHEPDGQPVRGHGHLAYAFEPETRRLLVVDPHERADRRLDAALTGLTDLRAGRSGRLTLAPDRIADGDAIVAEARIWETVTPYQVRRHGRGDRLERVRRDVIDACASMDWPRPESVGVRDVRSIPGVGVEAMVQLRFAAAVRGPILLGKTRHRGGGVFVGRG